jgi:hypothetical protein
LGIVSLEIVSLNTKALFRKLGKTGFFIYGLMLLSLYSISLQGLEGWVLQLNLIFLALLVMVSYLMLVIGDEGKNLGTDLMLEIRPISLGEVRRSESLAGILMLVVFWLPILGLSWVEIQHQGLGELRERQASPVWEKEGGRWALRVSASKGDETLEFIPKLYEMSGMMSDKTFMKVQYQIGGELRSQTLKMNRFNELKGQLGEIVIPEGVKDLRGVVYRFVPGETILWKEGQSLFPSLMAYGFHKLFLGSLLLLTLAWASRSLSVEMGLFAGLGAWFYYKATTILGPELYEESLGRLERLGPLDERFRNLWWEPLAHQLTQFSSYALEILQTLELSRLDKLLEKGQVATFELKGVQVCILLMVLLVPLVINKLSRRSR